MPGDGCGFGVAALVPRIRDDSEHAASSEDAIGSVDRSKCRIRLGHDGVIAARQVAEVEHDGTDPTWKVGWQDGFQISVRFPKHGCVPQAGFGELCFRRGDRCRLNVEREDSPALSDASSQKDSIVTVTGCRVDGEVSVLQNIGDSLLSEFGEAWLHVRQSVRRLRSTSEPSGVPSARCAAS